MQRVRSDLYMTKSNSNTDDDSGVSLDYDYSSSTDLNSSTTTFIESPPSYTIPNITNRKQIYETSFIRFPSDGIIERIRPATMKNSTNGDYIICQTNRGTYIAYRTPIVPAWVTQLVREIELREQ